MEKELKGYLDRISADIAEVKATMATKSELAEVKDSLTKEIRKVERKLNKKLDDNIEYTKMLDKEICDHRKNTEAHNAGLRGA